MSDKSSSLGTEEHIAIAISYALGWLTGLIVLLIEKENETVRYHAAQSIIVFGSVTILNIILPMVLFVLAIPFIGVINLLAVVLWVVFLVKALTQNPLKIGFISSYAEKLSGSVK